ncbi:sugar phosphate isomerase/epimerase family protein [Pseudonocardia parietis]|uniref:D-psicose/D-tagatose/L-ribulose 3-epimerase n=1 Tax=Pseudonocardia parietis TaxID=570936 RepID=A0ABS4VSB5_9PSEU|nr:sugar phosphate isomerase/epimerase family protein [Pseudonocardia parietis]MBP2366824.1 D-psicose/D-tagatose/L-ribulose 3-epimerase [Pseudonocardia parietis]
MSRPLGLSTFLLASPFSDEDARLAFEEVAALGYDVVEVCVEDPGRLSAPALTEAARATGLDVGVCGAFGPERDLSHDDPRQRRQGVDYLRGCIDLAAAVGSPHVAGPMYASTGKARMLPPDERAQQFRWAAESIREAADHAGERGVTLAIEPLNRFETDLVNTVERGLELCAATGRDNVGLLLDTFHMNIEEKHLGAAVRLAGDRVFHVQVAENDRGTPGSGHVPWAEFFTALDDIGYRGQVVVESFLPTVAEIARAVSLWRPVADSPQALARDAIAFLHSTLDPAARS